ncbi:MAG: MoaD/ThiS family protein [Acidobacteria bacterium]|nr:MoaD/ThiS family protein [Acidobacteriota bacterium]
MVTLRLFAGIREAAGTGRASFEAATVDEVIAQATAQFGDVFAEMVPICRVWLNGEPVDVTTAVKAGDEVALLPPVSGGG